MPTFFFCVIFDSCLHQVAGVKKKEVRLSNDKRTLGTSNFFCKSFAFNVLGLIPVRDIFFLKLRQLAATIVYVPNGRLFFLSMGQVKKKPA